MRSIRLQVNHLQQPRDGECLAASAMMVLNYLDFRANYRRIVRLLEIQTDFGAPSYNIRNLSRLGVQVEYKQGDLSALRQRLQNEQPCIVFVKTGELPYWQRNIDHAVVVVGIDDTQIYLNDPDLPNAPVSVSIGDFDLAWLERDELYAVLTV